MAITDFHRGRSVDSALSFRNVNAANQLKGVKKGTVAIDPASIAAATRGAPTFTLTGARSGDLIVMMPPTDLNDDLIYCSADVTADNTVTVYIYNPTLGAIDDTSRTWKYAWLSLG